MAETIALQSNKNSDLIAKNTRLQSDMDFVNEERRRLEGTIVTLRSELAAASMKIQKMRKAND